MPNFEMEKQPRFPLIRIDTDEPIIQEQLIELLSQNNGITLCVRSSTGHEKRGGHFFCIQKRDDGEIVLETMEQEYVDTFSATSMVRFINHTCGLEFDSEMQLYCQNSLNFRAD